MPGDKEHVRRSTKKNLYARLVSFATAACTTGSEAQRCCLVGGVSAPLV